MQFEFARPNCGAHERHPVSHAESPEERLQVLTHAGLRYLQLRRDLLVEAALGHELENPALTARKRTLLHLRLPDGA